MIKKASPQMVPQLIEIWKQCFGDSEEYIRMFMEANLGRCEVICFVEKEEPQSMAYLLPAEYVKKGAEPVSVYYLYAAATRMDCRKHGHFGKILEWIWENVPQPVILVPASENLETYYNRRGMHRWQKEERKIFQWSGACSPAVSTPLDARQYAQIRHQTFEALGYVRWDMQAMEYILRENEFCGGFCREIIINEETFAVLARKNGTTLEILELLTESHRVDDCVQYLMAEEKCVQAVVCIQPEVMVSERFSLPEEGGYFNLTLG